MQQTNSPIYYTPEQAETVRSYIAAHFGPNLSGTVFHETESEYVHTDILPAGSADKLHDTALVTCGVGAAKTVSPLEEYRRTELVLYWDAATDPFAPADNESFRRVGAACSELQRLSKFPFAHRTWFGNGHTVNAGKQFAETFGYTHFLFSDTGETCDVPDCGAVTFLAAYPLYPEEYDRIVREDTGDLFLAVYLDKILSGAISPAVNMRRDPLPPETIAAWLEAATPLWRWKRHGFRRGGIKQPVRRRLPFSQKGK